MSIHQGVTLLRDQRKLVRGDIPVFDQREDTLFQKRESSASKNLIADLPETQIDIPDRSGIFLGGNADFQLAAGLQGKSEVITGDA